MRHALSKAAQVWFKLEILMSTQEVKQSATAGILQLSQHQHQPQCTACAHNKRATFPTWRATLQRLSCMSHATTDAAPAVAAIIASRPEPVPRSTTCAAPADALTFFTTRAIALWKACKYASAENDRLEIPKPTVAIIVMTSADPIMRIFKNHLEHAWPASVQVLSISQACKCQVSSLLLSLYSSLH